jgi:predicted unusual protein kinase regulating ubiquinone biosynthesis (AarF/ABC1/UbiB family)
MSDTTQVTVEEVKVQVAAPVVPDALKSQLEAIIKETLKKAVEEILAELKKPAVVASVVAVLDKNGDGVVTPQEVKEVAVAAAKKWCC